MSSGKGGQAGGSLSDSEENSLRTSGEKKKTFLFLFSGSSGETNVCEVERESCGEPAVTKTPTRGNHRPTRGRKRAAVWHSLTRGSWTVGLWVCCSYWSRITPRLFEVSAFTVACSTGRTEREGRNTGYPTNGCRPYVLSQLKRPGQWRKAVWHLLCCLLPLLSEAQHHDDDFHYDWSSFFRVIHLVPTASSSEILLGCLSCFTESIPVVLFFFSLVLCANLFKALLSKFHFASCNPGAEKQLLLTHECRLQRY